MKIKNLVITSFVSLFSAALLAVSAHAQITSYNNTDALFGFRVTSGTGSTLDGMIDLGSVSQFNHTFTLSLGSIGTFMTTNFGADWFTRIDAATGRTSVQWAVVADDIVANTLWSTRNPSLVSPPWPRNSDSSQSITATNIETVAGTYSGNPIATGTTSAMTQATSVANSWASWQPGGANSSGISFATWNPTNEGSTNTVLAFDSILSSNTGGLHGTTLGFFTWNSDGTLTFTVVPEPETYELMALGAVGLVGLQILRRRRTVRA